MHLYMHISMYVTSIYMHIHIRIHVSVHSHVKGHDASTHTHTQHVYIHVSPRGSKYHDLSTPVPNTIMGMVFGFRDLHIGYLDPLGVREQGSYSFCVPAGTKGLDPGLPLQRAGAPAGASGALPPGLQV